MWLLRLFILYCVRLYLSATRLCLEINLYERDFVETYFVHDERVHILFFSIVNIDGSRDMDIQI